MESDGSGSGPGGQEPGPASQEPARGNAATGRGSSIRLSLPVSDADLFKHGASKHVLDVLSDSPELQLSIRQLAGLIPFSERATRESVDVLEANGLVTTERRDNARLTRIDRERLDRTDDPISTIPQEEFQLPVRVATSRIERELDAVQGIVLFGSVATGDADRKSDVDLWVLVGTEPVAQQHRANKLANQLSELEIPSAIAPQGAIDPAEIEDVCEWIEAGSVRNGAGQRYDFEIVVENPQSLLRQRADVNLELFTDSITLRTSTELRAVTEEVVRDG